MELNCKIWFGSSYCHNPIDLKEEGMVKFESEYFSYNLLFILFFASIYFLNFLKLSTANSLFQPASKDLANSLPKLIADNAFALPQTLLEAQQSPRLHFVMYLREHSF